MKEFTDTERLNWLLGHSPDRDFTWQTGEHWMVWLDYNEQVGKQKYLARGKSYRECIDNALAGNTEILKY